MIVPKLKRIRGRDSVDLLCLAVFTALGLCASLVCSQVTDPADSTLAAILAQADWVDPDAAAQLLAELNASGSVLTGEDWRRLALPAQDASRATSPADSHPPGGWHGRFSWRIRLSPAGLPVYSGNLKTRWQSCQGGLRWYRTADGQTYRQGYAGWNHGHWRLLAGGFGWQWGHGLLWSGPGQWRGLSVTTSLVPRDGEGKGHTGLPDRQTIQGGFAQGGFGGWRLVVLAGRPHTGPLAVTDRAVVAVGTTVGFRQGLIGVMWSRQGDGRGGSVTLRSRLGPIQLQMESALWQAGPARPWRQSWVAAGRWRHTSWLVELVSMTSNGAGAPVGRQPALLSGWLGWGWALRGWKLLGKHTRISWLLARGEGRDVTRALPSSANELHLELALRWRAATGWTGEVNHRLARDSQMGWDGRYPWLPPELMQEKYKTQTQVTLRGRWRQVQTTLAVRRLQEDRLVSVTSPRVRRSRQLVGIRVAWRQWATWDLRAAWYWAWGDDVDLVSVASVVPGYVSLRHWGRWQAETHVSLGWRVTSMRLQAGLARRLPVDRESLRPWWEGVTYLICDW
jgi:hypothetical protein